MFVPRNDAGEIWTIKVTNEDSDGVVLDDGTASIEILKKRYKGKYGNIVTCITSPTPQFSSNGDLQYFITEIQDITERKESEESLKKEIDLRKQIEDSRQRIEWLIKKSINIIHYNPI